MGENIDRHMLRGSEVGGSNISLMADKWSTWSSAWRNSSMPDYSETEKNFMAIQLDNLKKGMHHISSYNAAIEHGMERIIRQMGISDEGIEIRFSSFRLESPVRTKHMGTDESYPEYPQNARREGKTYSGKMYCTASVEVNGTRQNEQEIYIGDMPIMLHSSKCNLSKIKREDLPLYGEDPYNFGGTFIVKGKEYLLVTMEQLAKQKILVVVLGKGKELNCRMTATGNRGPVLTQLKKNIRGEKSHKPENNMIFFSMVKEGLISNIERGDSAPSAGHGDTYVQVHVFSLFRLLGYSRKEAMEKVLDYTDDANRNRVRLAADNDFFLADHRMKSFKDLFENNYGNINAEADPQLVHDFIFIYFLFVSINGGDDPKKKFPYQKFWTKEAGGLLPSQDGNMIKATVKYIVDSKVMSHITDMRDLLTAEDENETVEMLEKRIYEYKANLLAMMYARLIETDLGMREVDDMNDWGNKKLVTSGNLIEEAFRSVWRQEIDKGKQILNGARGRSRSTTRGAVVGDSINIDLKSLIKPDSIKKAIFDSFSSKRWRGRDGPRDEGKGKVSQEAENHSKSALQAHLGLLDAPVLRKTPNKTIREVQPSQNGYIDAAKTPEGKAVGITKDISMFTFITPGKDEVSFYQKSFMIINKLGIGEFPTDDKGTRVIINGLPLGFVNGKEAAESFRNSRRTQEIDRYTSIVYISTKKDAQKDSGWLYVDSQASRLTRPLYVVKDNKVLADDFPNAGTSLEELFKNDLIEFITPAEQEMLLIAKDRDDLKKYRENKARVQAEYEEASNVMQMSMGPSLDHEYEQKKRRYDEAVLEYERYQTFQDYTHCDISPLALMGFSTGMVPWANHNQAPRITYQTAMARQALVVPDTNTLARFEGYKLAPRSEPPLFGSCVGEIYGINEHGVGSAMRLMFGASKNTEEDSYRQGSQCADFGSFWNMRNIIKKNEQMDKNQSTQLRRPNTDNMSPREKLRYANIADNGLPIIGAFLREGDCVIGEVAYVSTHVAEIGSAPVTTESNKSTFMKKGEYGKVVNVRMTEGNKVFVKIQITRRSTIGDKHAPPIAQKVTTGEILPRVKMPFDPRTGEFVDLITNPTQIPSRMTMSFPRMVAAGNVASLTGKRQNATPYTKYNPLDPQISDKLEEYGYSKFCVEKTINPATKTLYKEPMFQGMVMIQSLKHHVEDKAQSRTTGARVPQTGQPTRGKATGGGLRTGEMEKDALQNHGASQVLFERMCGTVTDGETLPVCLNEGCGEYGHYNDSIGKFFCRVCRDKYLSSKNSDCAKCGSEYTKEEDSLKCSACGDVQMLPYFNMGRVNMCMTTKYFRDLLRVPGINMGFEYETNARILDGLKGGLESFNKMIASSKYSKSKQDDMDEDDIDEDDMDEEDAEDDDIDEDEIDEELLEDFEEF